MLVTLLTIVTLVMPVWNPLKKEVMHTKCVPVSDSDSDLCPTCRRDSVRKESVRQESESLSVTVPVPVFIEVTPRPFRRFRSSRKDRSRKSRSDPRDGQITKQKDQDN